jgi:hypothetical protein
MLRTIVNEHYRPRVVGLRYTTSGGTTASVSTGVDNTKSATWTAAGSPLILMKEPFHRNCVVVGSHSDTTSIGGYFIIANAPTATGIQSGIRSNGGSQEEGSANALVFGWNNSSSTNCSPQDVLGTTAYPRIISGVMGTSTALVLVGAGDFTLTRPSTGTYTVTFKKAFSSTPVVVATGSTPNNTIRSARVTNVTATGCTVTLADNTNALANGFFHIVALGSDCRDSYGGRDKPLQNSQRKPRIIAATYNVGGAMAVGAEDITLSTMATGDYQFIFKEPFKRAPTVIATSGSTRCEIYEHPTATGCRIQTFTSGGSLADDSRVNFIVIGSDDPSEY